MGTPESAQNLALPVAGAVDYRLAGRQKKIVIAAKFEISKDHAGRFRFHLRAPNGEIIAASWGYETKANAEKGIEAIKTHTPGAKVEDHSDA